MSDATIPFHVAHARAVAFGATREAVETLQQVADAKKSLRRAIYAYECAGLGFEVTRLLREALGNLESFMNEVAP